MAAVFVIYIPRRDYEKKLDEKSKAKEEKNGSQYLSGSNSTPNLITAASSFTSLPENCNSIDRRTKEDRKRRKNNAVVQNGSSSPSSPSLSPDKDEKVIEQCMESELRLLLANFKLESSVWLLTQDQNFHQVVFPCESQEQCETILSHLHVLGIGRFKESSVSVVPCSVYCQGDHDELNQESSVFEGESVTDIKDDKKSAFMKSIKARLTVAQVVDGVRAGATLTFDFVAFIILAGLIAGFGLMDSSSVSIVASMLVSPLMGPIMAICFGAVVSDKSLFKLGLKNELVGLTMCISVGFILGLINAPWAIEWGKGPWPTSEMFARGQTRALWVGVLVALPSGAGVALSVVGANISSLVGVAISASLLPPCVNCGILWGNAVVVSLKAIADDIITQMYLHNGDYVNVTNRESLLPPADYDWQYSDNMAYESATLGVISLCLSLVNIGSIIIAAIAVLKIKEVAPLGSMPATGRFFREDIRIARDYNRSVHHGDHDFREQWNKVKSASDGDLDEVILRTAEDDEVYQTIVRVTGNQFTLPPRNNERRGSYNVEDGNEPKTSLWDALSIPRGLQGSFRRATLVEARNRRCSSTPYGRESGRRRPFASVMNPPVSRFNVVKADESNTANHRRRSLSKVPEMDTIL